MGLNRTKCIKSINNKQGKIIHEMSTKSGHSGSPIIFIRG
jgi:V8-like Glu-specific endopeptidase